MQRVVFLDRDGTINVDHGYVVRIEDWQFLPGAIGAMQALQQAGWKLAVVTNQSGVAAGRYRTEDVERLHQYVTDELQKHNVYLSAIAYYPHAVSDGCDCRKPATGMAHAIESRMQTPIDFAGSWTIGDKPSDIGFGQELGTRTTLLSSRYWDAETLTAEPTFMADSLWDATQRILGEGR